MALSPLIQQTLFLCPSKILLDVVPLHPSHRNPLSLSFDQYLVDIYDSARPVELSVDSSASTNMAAGPPPPISRLPNVHPLKVMTTSSLIKTLIILRAFYPPDERRGVERPFLFTLFLLCVDTRDQRPHIFGSRSIQRLWDELYSAQGLADPDRPDLWDDVRSEWGDKLGLEHVTR